MGVRYGGDFPNRRWPKTPKNTHALAELPVSESESESEDNEIVGEFDDDEIYDDLPVIQQERDSESTWWTWRL